MNNTTFGNLPNLSYFAFTNESEEPKSPEGLDCNVWQKSSMRIIRKVGEQKQSTVRFAKSITSVFLVAKDLDELIANSHLKATTVKLLTSYNS